MSKKIIFYSLSAILVLALSIIFQKKNSKDDFIPNKSNEENHKPIYHKPIYEVLDKDDSKPKKPNEENHKTIYGVFDDAIQSSSIKIKEYIEMSITLEDGNFQLNDSTIHFFNRRGKIIKQLSYNKDKKLNSITIEEYDHKNQKTRYKSKAKEDEYWFEIRYHYNQAGQLISEVTKGILLGVDSCQYVYDDKNYIVKKISFAGNGTIWRTDWYSYDSNGNTVSVITTGEKNDTVSVFTQRFDNRNLCIESQKYGEPINCSGRNIWKYQYNEYGEMVSETTHDLTVKHIYEYDKHKNKTKELTFYNNDKTPNYIISRTFKYY